MSEQNYQGYQNYPQQPNPQQGYQPYPNYQAPMPGYGQVEEPVSIKEWLLSYLIMCIPVVGFVMMFVWAFGSSTKKSKSNFFKAALIWAVIVTVLMIAFYVIVGAAMLAMIGSAGGFDPSSYTN